MGIDPMALQAAVTIYRNRRAAAYLVQPMRRYGRLGLADAGDAKVVESSSDTSLSQIILNELDEFDTDQIRSSEPTRHAPKEQANFIRAHDAVMVTRRLDGRLEITPCEHFQGGFKAISAATIALDPPLSARSLIAAVEEAFTHADRN